MAKTTKTKKPAAKAAAAKRAPKTVRKVAKKTAAKKTLRGLGDATAGRSRIAKSAPRRKAATKTKR